MNWEALETELSAILKDSLDGVVNGAQEDLKTYGKAIARDLVVVIQANRTDLMDELFDQAILIAEVHRISLNRRAKVTLEKLLQAVARTGLALLGAIV